MDKKCAKTKNNKIKIRLKFIKLKYFGSSAKSGLYILYVTSDHFSDIHWFWKVKTENEEDFERIKSYYEILETGKLYDG